MNITLNGPLTPFLSHGVVSRDGFRCLATVAGQWNLIKSFVGLIMSIVEDISGRIIFYVSNIDDVVSGNDKSSEKLKANMIRTKAQPRQLNIFQFIFSRWFYRDRTWRAFLCAWLDAESSISGRSNWKLLFSIFRRPLSSVQWPHQGGINCMSMGFTHVDDVHWLSDEAPGIVH